jgi:hypothetical protein
MDAKTEVMQQVRQQAAIANARALVEVCQSIPILTTIPNIPISHSNSPHPSSLFPVNFPDHDLIRSLPETQRTLLRPLHPDPGLLALVRRIDLLHQLHGEVHGGVEHHQQAVLDARAEGRGLGHVKERIARCEKEDGMRMDFVRWGIFFVAYWLAGWLAGTHNTPVRMLGCCGVFVAGEWGFFVRY